MCSRGCQPCNRRSNLPPLKLRFIVNPRSGAARHALPAVEAFAARHGAAVRLTEHARHASDLTRQALQDGCDVVVAVGGDGTMNEVASVLTGTPGVLGLVPCGSGDGFGRHLRIHGPPAHALAILEAGHVRTVDSGLAGGHPFFCAAGLGFEAEIARRFNALRRRGFLRYVTTSAAAWRQWRPRRYTIRHAAGTDVVDAFTLVVANAEQYGNDARVAAGARIDDGRLDLVAVPPVTLLNAGPLALRLFRGTLDRDRRVLRRSDTAFVVEGETPNALHTDGEIHAAGASVEFRIRPASLRVLAPPA